MTEELPSISAARPPSPSPFPSIDAGLTSGPEWVDNDNVVFIAREDPALYEQELRKKKDTTKVVDDVSHEPPVRLFMLAAKDRKVHHPRALFTPAASGKP